MQKATQGWKGSAATAGLAAVIVIGYVVILYAAIVAGGVSLWGRAARSLLSVLATGIVAVTFERVRAGAQNAAARVVHGRRFTPMETLTSFADRVGETPSAKDALPTLARLVAGAVGGAQAEVWVRVGSELVPAAGWPEDHDLPERVCVEAELLPPIAGASGVVPVILGNELLGAIVVRTRSGEPPTPVEERLLSDVASQAGLVLRNERLTSELAARVDEVSAKAAALRSSRRRIVAAQDAERRRLERDIHDGAQQHLVALAVKVRLTEAIIENDRQAGVALLQETRELARDALDTLRDLARGIYPPVLAERGVAAAIRAQTARGAVAVAVEDSMDRRCPPDIEAAIYFAVLEALQNVAKYSGALSALVRLSEEKDLLRFDVVDDGTGFDAQTTPPGSGLRNMTDRIASVGGTVEVVSAPGRGTTITGRLPIVFA